MERGAGLKVNAFAVESAIPAFARTPRTANDNFFDIVSSNTVAPTNDDAGRETATTTTIAGLSGALATSYTLDANSNPPSLKLRRTGRTKLLWPDGYYVGYCYDVLNRMSVAMANSTSSACATSVLASYTYDPYSRRTNLAYGASASMAYGYTPAGDLTSLTDTLNTTPNSNAFTLGYTNAHQLAREAYSNAAFVQAGTGVGATAYAAVNVLNQYPSVTPAGGSATTQSYDAKGNLTGDGTYTFAYDPENRLVTAAKTGLAATYTYDPLGRREKKSGTGVTGTFFLQDGADEIAEYNTSGTLQRRFVPGPAIDDIIAMVPASGTTELFYTDHHGSTIATSDASGNLVEGPFSYDAYGNCFLGSAQTTACSTVTTGEPFKYTGQYFDAETNCYYYRARYYCADPLRGGRFLQTDPVGYKDDLNLYAYAGNDPMDRDDPNGMDACGDSGVGGTTGSHLSGGDPSVPCGSTGPLKDFGSLRSPVNGNSSKSDSLAQPQSTADNSNCPGCTRVAANVPGDTTIFRTPGDLSEDLSQRTKWAQVGVWGEKEAEGALIAKGYTIIGTHVYVRTSAGLRVTDFLITGGILGKDIAGYEVKVNNSPYLPSQQLKDSLIHSQGGTVVSRDSLLFGQTMRYQTYLMYVKSPEVQ